MKRLALLLCLFALLFYGANAQVSFPPAFEIKNDSTNNVLIPDNFWQVLEDTTGKWTIEQVSQAPLSAKFHKNSGFNYNINTYWIRYNLKNPMAHDLTIAIGSNAPYYDLFLLNDSMQWSHQRTGSYVPWSQRSGIRRQLSIPVTIGPGKQILVYKRIQYDFKISRPKSFVTGFRFIEYNNDAEVIDYVRSGFLFGIFLLTALINFFFFWVVKERVYLYYSLAMFFASLLYFSNPLYHIFFKESPKLFQYCLPIFVAFLLFFLVQTFRHFLNTYKYYPIWDKYLNLLGFIPFMVLLSVFIFNAPATTLIYMQALLYLSLFVTCFLLIRSKERNSRLVIIASLPVFIILVLINVVNSLGLGTPLLNRLISNLELLFQFWAIAVFSWILARRYQNLQMQIAQEAIERERMAKEKEIGKSQPIAQQKQELEINVAERTAELTQSLEDLQKMQKQLVHTEKMASLGELTAGIAHEIQNPLNFVNNFSEVSIELLQELKEEKQSGQVDAVTETEIIEDIEQNLRKIVHHGHRADAIIKNMLQHARTSAGEKQWIDINALAEEYFLLSYHGMRAKDKSFNASLQTEFDPNVGKVCIIGQDISRVLLNLFQNAFYSVSDKRKYAGNCYMPQISLNTKLQNDMVEISVRDNGTGIPEDLITKIFQPFFTTKPTGEGTGLGLSLSYDIITKGHGGNLVVHTKKGEFAEFIVSIPKNS